MQEVEAGGGVGCDVFPVLSAPEASRAQCGVAAPLHSAIDVEEFSMRGGRVTGHLRHVPAGIEDCRHTVGEQFQQGAALCNFFRYERSEDGHVGFGGLETVGY